MGSNIKIFFVLCSFFVSALTLYEDQVGKFEWRQQYIGKPKYLTLDTISPTKKIIAVSEKNVLAALSLKSGDILWRHLLVDGPEGSVQGLYLDDEIVTITGLKNAIVRGFELETGHLLWEWSAPIIPNEIPRWVINGEHVLFMDISPTKAAITRYSLRSGNPLSTYEIILERIDPKSCLVVDNKVVCLNNNGLSLLTVEQTGEVVSRSIVLGESSGRTLRRVDGHLSVISIIDNNEQVLMTLDSEVLATPFNFPTSAVVTTASADEKEIILSVNINNQKAQISAMKKTGERLADLEGTLQLPSITGDAQEAVAACLNRRDGSLSCRIVVTTVDHVLVTLHLPGSVLWLREEALASVQVVEMMDLPVPDAVAVEREFGGQTVGFFELFYRRLIGQWRQLRGLLLLLLGDTNRLTSGFSTLLRDDFGLRKLILVVTQPGKVFGLDSVTGAVVWRIITEMTPPFSAYVTRTAIHAPRTAVVSLIGRTNDGNTLLLTVDPVSGSILESRPLKRILQVLSLPVTDREYLRPLLLLDDREKLIIHPEGSPVDFGAIPSFLYTVDQKTGQVIGYHVRVSKSLPTVTRAWTLNLGQDDAHVVVAVGKRDMERVHSQGRVLGDRSVLYKYVNPNLIAVLTMGQHPAHKGVLNVYLIDAVSGLVVWSACHKRARAPVHAVHAENWLVYSWVSDKHRRTEMATVELFEGEAQANATAFSSLATPPLLPIAERQAYILPSSIRALTDTVTEKGITNKHIIVALSNGGVLELPWAYLDPRRTVTVTPDLREEGVIPYIPELPLISEAILNHNLSVWQVRGLHTSPSGLESTSLLLVYGLDLFYTRVAPSKTFDLLKEDFDYVLITAVLGGLILASIVTRRLSSRKALRQAWK